MTTKTEEQNTAVTDDTCMGHGPAVAHETGLEHGPPVAPGTSIEHGPAVTQGHAVPAGTGMGHGPAVAQGTGRRQETNSSQETAETISLGLEAGIFPIGSSYGRATRGSFATTPASDAAAATATAAGAAAATAAAAATTAAVLSPPAAPLDLSVVGQRQVGRLKSPHDSNKSRDFRPNDYTHTLPEEFNRVIEQEFLSRPMFGLPTNPLGL